MRRGQLKQTVLAGLVGGLAFCLTMIATFRLIGFGWNGDGILLDPGVQSAKLILVWTSLEPLPLVLAKPGAIFPV